MQFAKLPILLLLLLAFGARVSAQDRYLEPVFSQASKTTAIYGSNFTFLPLLQGGNFTRQPLVMQVYSPVGDTETARPLIIYLHTGNFFPYPANGSCGGLLTDSSNVAFATRLAQMGYVVAVADYRLGWNPFSDQELIRRFTLINAAYRGVQDVRACIRYFRKSVAEGGNPWGVDPEKIVVWGQGTGGYLSLATAYLDDFNEIYTTADPNKFKLPVPNVGFIPMVQENYNGDVYGVQAAPGVVDAFYSAISGFDVGDTMYVQNHPGYSSDFHLAVNMGGALGDSSWMDAGDVPLISYHVPSDFFAPCETDILNVPTINGPQPVVEVSGSCDMQDIAADLGLNEIFNTIPDGFDPFGELSISDKNGFYPFVGTPDNTSAPWEWTPPGYLPAPAPTADCNQDGAVAHAYIDTIIGYFAPRACVTLGLGCNFVKTTELNDLELGLQVSPVPSSDAVTFQTKEMPIRQIYVYDLSGRMVKAHTGINSTVFQMQRNSLTNGMYIAELRFDGGFVKRKIVFNN